MALALAAGALVACGGEPGEDLADTRAAQFEAAARDAGLDDDVVAFLGRAARGSLATHTAVYPGPEAGTTLRVVSRPPDRRVDVLRGDEVIEASIVVDGAAHRCTTTTGPLTCERTDAFVEPPGVFRSSVLDELVNALVEGSDDFDFTVTDGTVAGTEVRCLTTTSIADDAVAATLCVTDDGTLALVERPGERLEALSLTDAVDDDAFTIPAR